MATERPGCLLFALPRAVFSPSRPALGECARLPPLESAHVHRDDLPSLVRARRAGQACLDELRGVAGSAVVVEVAAQVVGVVSSLDAVARRLGEARAFIQRHRPDALARERADLELSMIGASPAAIREHRRSLESLEARARLAGELGHRIETLTARLASGGHELEALHARIGASLGDDLLMHELRAYQASARAALDAFEEAWREIEAVSS